MNIIPGSIPESPGKEYNKNLELFFEKTLEKIDIKEDMEESVNAAVSFKLELSSTLDMVNPPLEEESKNILTGPQITMTTMIPQEIPNLEEVKDETPIHTQRPPTLLVNSHTPPHNRTIQNQSSSGLFDPQFIARYVSKSDYFPIFIWKHFFKYFTYNFVYLMLFGPLCTPVIAAIESIALLRNMFMWGSVQRIQAMIWFLYVSSLLLYFIFPNANISGAQVLVVSGGAILRILIIGIRYGYTSKRKIEIYEHIYIQFSEMKEDFLQSGWILISPKQIMDELYAGMWEIDVEEEFFTFTFVDQITPEYMERLKMEEYFDNNLYDVKKDRILVENSHRKIMEGRRLSKQIRRMSVSRVRDLSVASREQDLQNRFRELFFGMERNFIPTASRQDMQIAYKGKLLAREILLLAKLQSSRAQNAAFYLSFIHTILPFVLNLLQRKPIVGDTWQAIYVSIVHIILSYYLYMMNIKIVSIAIFDFRQKLFMMNALTSLLSPKKNKKFECCFIIPTINFFLPMNLINWMKLRKILMNAGTKFAVRMEAYTSCFLVLYLSVFILLMLAYFDLLINISITTEFAILAGFDALLFLTIVIYIMYLGAKVNQHIIFHKDAFISHKNLLEAGMAIHQNREMLFRRRKNPYQGRLMRKVWEVSQEYFHGKSTEEIDSTFQTCINIIDNLNEQLEIEGELRPLKLLGIKPTFDVLKAFSMAILSLIFIVINKELNLL